ncbi:CapA family protein [Nocardioidaceae bacterium]|nr:CapA family protein [Nocardioidaceae bacterium]
MRHSLGRLTGSAVALVALGTVAACSDTRDTRDPGGTGPETTDTTSDGSALGSSGMSGSSSGSGAGRDDGDLAAPRSPEGSRSQERDDGPPRRLSLAFAGDIHFEGALEGLLTRRGSDLGPMAPRLREADLAVVNLETALSGSRARDPKALEVPGQRYWFRADPDRALAVLARSGVDAASMANNHAGDYGQGGLRSALGAASRSPVKVVGARGDRAAAFRPATFRVRGVSVGVLAVDSSIIEGASPVWSAERGTGPGIAAAHGRDTGRILAATRRAARDHDVVVVMPHWGTAGMRCPDAEQQRIAAELTEAGADVIVGAHAHVTQGAGMMGDSYVGYGLGDFAWYHGQRPRTGVLTVDLSVDGDRVTVVGDDWATARIPAGGGVPRPSETPRQDTEHWQNLRGCAGLAPVGAPEQRRDDALRTASAPRTDDGLPAYEAQVDELPPAVRRRMTGVSHQPDQCPVSLDELRLLTVDRVAFDGSAKQGRIVVHQDVADEVVDIFGEIYDAGFPIRRMRLVDAYGGDDNRSMRANNTSGYNCRTVAGTDRLSNHAFGRAIDINPRQNPYVTSSGVQPRGADGFAEAPRQAGADAADGVIVRGGPVMNAFTIRGWSWGADFADYQHFAKN